MVEISNLLSDDEAVVWIREFGQKHANQSMREARQIGYGFRKSRRAVGVADHINIHAEFVDPVTKDRYLVSWLPLPLFDSVNKNVSEQREAINRFKAEAGFPASYNVSFGSADQISAMAMAYVDATRVDTRYIDPFNGMIVNTTTRRMDHYRLQLKWEHDRISRAHWPWDEDCGFPNMAVFPVGVIKALSIAELIPEGYKFDQDVSRSKFEMKDLEFISVLENGENPIRGNEIYNRAVKHKANFGYADAMHILARSDQIPANIKSVIFPGACLEDKTRLIDARNCRVTPYIYRQDDPSRPDFGAWLISFLGFNSPCTTEDHFVHINLNTGTTDKGGAL